MPLVALRFANNQQLQAAARNSPPLKHGTTGKAVELLQRSLIELGFGMPVSTDKNTNVPDGIYGNETARTVRSFQAQHGLGQDGVAGEQTLQRLDQLFSAAEALELAKLPLDSRKQFWT